MKQDEKYLVSGMSCAACSARVDKAVRSLKGVKEVNVNLLTNSMLVSYDENKLNSEQIINAVERSGYGAKLSDKKQQICKEDLKDLETPKLLKRLIISVVLLIPLFYLSMGYMLGWPIGVLRGYLFILAIIEGILSLSIMCINYKFFINGTRALIKRSPNMDSLVMLGSSVAYIYSFVLMILLFVQTASGETNEMLNMTMMNISFETAGMVPTLITIGKTLESYSKGKTTNSIKSLMDLSPQTAILIVNKQEKETPIEEVKVGDIFIVKPGMRIPVDGEIVEGFSSIDESMLTGEPLPIDKEIGSIVKSGTICSDGSIICKAIRVGESTTLNQIIQSVEKAANSKAKISKIADIVSGVFVPIVILFALITFLFWFLFGGDFVSSHSDIHSNLLSYSIERAIAILVISCPCALGLATPVAIMVGSGKAARNGILFKNAEAIEETGKISYVVFDKTGTITKGKPTVTDVYNYINGDEFISLAASIEAKSSHPLARAVVELAKRNNLEIYDSTDFVNVPGYGVSVKIGKDSFVAGSYKYFMELGFDVKKDKNEIEKLIKTGKTPVLFAKNGKLFGYVAVSDTVKDDSKEAIASFKKLGIVPIMLTGDNSYSAKLIASQVGIDYVISDVLPEGKLEIINKLKQYDKVMMVGDGINDAIALTSADIGMAIGQGSDIAIDSSAVVLMRSSLMDAYKAVRLSQYVYLNIKENLFWAFIYNLIMIPIAAGAFSALGLYKVAPWMGSAAMAASSVFVVLNALRINLFNPSKIKHKNKKVIIPNELSNENMEENNMEKIYKVEGMMCMHCVAHVKEALLKVKGVTSVEVSLEKGTAKVSSSKEIKDKDIVKAITKAGYKVR